MNTINLIIADDEQYVHNNLRDSLRSIKIQFEVIKDFYDTASLMRYLRALTVDDVLESALPDILVLDHDFGGRGTNGLDRVPQIRQLFPNLPILILTGSEYTDVEEFHQKYNLSYVKKPFSNSQLHYEIKDTIKKMQDMSTLETMIQESSTKWQNEIETIQVLPPDMFQLIQNIFPDIEFSTRAFRLLIKKINNTIEWNRMFKCLKLIDWKNEKYAPAGTKIQKYNDSKNNVWEYRFSKAGRIFAQRRQNERPLILLIDPYHRYSDITLF